MKLKLLVAIMLVGYSISFGEPIKSDSLRIVELEQQVESIKDTLESIKADRNKSVEVDIKDWKDIVAKIIPTEDEDEKDWDFLINIMVVLIPLIVSVIVFYMYISNIDKFVLSVVSYCW